MGGTTLDGIGRAEPLGEGLAKVIEIILRKPWQKAGSAGSGKPFTEARHYLRW